MSFEQDKYVIVKNAISTELADFIYDYFLNKRMVAKTLLDSNFDFYSKTGLIGTWSHSQIPNTYSHYSDIVMETLLQRVKPIMEKTPV